MTDLTNWIDANFEAIAKRLPADFTGDDVQAAILAELEDRKQAVLKLMHAPKQAQEQVARSMYHSAMSDLHREGIATALKS